jgi:hypothetical protein
MRATWSVLAVVPLHRCAPQATGGNFPQAFSSLTLIPAALAISESLAADD